MLSWRQSLDDPSTLALHAAGVLPLFAVVVRLALVVVFLAEAKAVVEAIGATLDKQEN